MSVRRGADRRESTSEISDLPYPRIGDEPWQRDAVEAVARFRASNRALYRLARSHRHALDYLLQAPCLAALKEADQLIAGGVTLRDILRRAGLSRPMRSIAIDACLEEYEATFRALGRLHPSLVAQAIPAKSKAHGAWMRDLHRWRQTVARIAPDFHFEWAVAHAARAADINDIADFIVAEPATFNHRWTLARARAACEEWHRRTLDQKKAEQFFKRHSLAIDEPVDIAPLPITADIGGHCFVALRSGTDLLTEGRVMRHCVASYASKLIEGCSRLFSLRLGDDIRVATLEIAPTKRGWRVVQIKGPRNGDPGEAARFAAATFAASLPAVETAPELAAPHA